MTNMNKMIDQKYILLKRPKWSDGVRTSPSDAILLKWSPSNGGIVKSPIIAISLAFGLQASLLLFL